MRAEGTALLACAFALCALAAPFTPAAAAEDAGGKAGAPEMAGPARGAAPSVELDLNALKALPRHRAAKEAAPIRLRPPPGVATAPAGPPGKTVTAHLEQAKPAQPDAAPPAHLDIPPPPAPASPPPPAAAAAPRQASQAVAAAAPQAAAARPPAGAPPSGPPPSA